MGLQLDQNYELCTENFESQFLLSDDNDTSWYTTYEETTFVQVSAGSSHCAGLTKMGPFTRGALPPRERRASSYVLLKFQFRKSIGFASRHKSCVRF